MIDTHELICHLCNLDDDSTYDELEQAVFDKYEVSIDAFDAIAHALLQLIDVGKSELTGEIYKGFSVQANGYGFWLLKTKVKS